MSGAIPVLNVRAKAFYVGGAVMLDFRDPVTNIAPTGTVTITRTCVAGLKIGTTDIVISGGEIDPLWLDTGNGIQSNGSTVSGPLASGQYIYNITAVIGGYTISVVTPTMAIAKMISIVPDGMNDVFISVLSGALQILTMPPGMSVPRVFNSMPVAGLPALPFVSVNEEMIQQVHVPIGQQAFSVDSDNTVTISEMAKRMWRISVFTNIAEERDYLRDFLIGALKVIAKDLFEPLGRNNSHKFQAVSYSKAKEGEVPGFFGCDILYDTDGNYNTSLTTSNGVIKYIVGVANPE